MLVGLLPLQSALGFLRLSENDGAEVSGYHISAQRAVAADYPTTSGVYCFSLKVTRRPAPAALRCRQGFRDKAGPQRTGGTQM